MIPTEHVEINATNRAIAVERSTLSDDAGRYQIPSPPVGDYRIEVQARGVQSDVNLAVDVLKSDRCKVLTGSKSLAF